MIFSDRDLKKLLKEGKIKVEPIDLEKQIMPVGVDLRLGNDFRLFKTGADSHIDPSKTNMEATTELIKVEDGKSFILHPGEFILGVTKECVQLPDDIAARIDGRSSLGRLGIIVHSTAGHIDPGFTGNLTLEITNIGKLPVSIYPGMKFCSLIFEQISSSVEKPYSKKGKYCGSAGPMTSKIKEEFK